MISLNGIKHWVRVAGAENKTMPLVIIHGGPGGNNYVFERTIGPRLEQFATVIYYEQRGCGRSEAPADPADYSMAKLVNDLEALRQDLQLEHIVPLGYSFGGALALEYALAYPGRAEKLVVSAPSCGDMSRIAVTQLYGFAQVEAGEIRKSILSILSSSAPIEEKIDQAWSVVDTETVDRLLFYRPENATLNRSMWQASGLLNNSNLAKAVIPELVDPGWIQRLRQIKAPTLVMVGLYDRNVGVDSVRDIAQAISNSRLVTFERSAHFPDIEEPEKYAATVSEFLRM
jgi:proline iminopeptidase